MLVVLAAVILLLVGKSDDSISSWIERGKALAESGKYRDAVAEFEKVLEKDPLNGTALFNLGNIYGSYLGDRERGELYWKKYKAASHVSLAEVAMEENDIEEAAAQYEKAIEILPGNGRLHELLGALYKRMGREDEALGEYRKAADLQPRDLQLQLAMWEYFSKKGQGEEAAAYLERAIETRPRDARLRRVAIAFYRKLGDSDRAMEQLFELSQSGLATREEHCLLGEQFIRRGELGKAEKELRLGYGEKTRARCLKAALDLGGAWAKRGEHEKAAAVYRAVLEAGGSDAKTFNLLLISHQKSGRIDAAVSTAERAVAAFPDNAALRNNLAVLYAMRKEYRRAIEEYRRAVKLDPGLAGAYLDMGIIYVDYLGERQKAAEAFRKYLVLEPEGRKRPEVIRVLGFED